MLFLAFAVPYCFDKEVPRGWLRALMLAMFAWWLASLAAGSGPGMAGMILCWGLLFVCLVSFGNQAWSKPFRIARSAALVLIVSVYLVGKSGLIQPFNLGDSCISCSARLKNLAGELDMHLEKYGKYPPTLESFSSPSVCPPNEVNSPARTLYGWQGITFERYIYEVSSEAYTLSCQTCHQRWSRKPGYPRYSSVHGLEGTGLDNGTIH